MPGIVVIGGGPAGYEAALVAAQLGADVTVVERDGAGGACVLSDCVPSKTFIASSDAVTAVQKAKRLGVRVDGLVAQPEVATIHDRVRQLAKAQSDDVESKLVKAGVRYIPGTARL
ncbi:MAG TPA: FAD-dependent oxidoreductase, partial [Micromonosporaceae bacterium]|nr:FAD-dependent oxidoreductase [Micromonosporaceae bacterium]